MKMVGKLHKLVKYILASPQRREEFGDIKGGRKVKEFDHLGVSCFYNYRISPSEFINFLSFSLTTSLIASYG